MNIIETTAPIDISELKLFFSNKFVTLPEGSFFL